MEIGSGNPGAVGIDFLVNNRGGLFNVTVKSLDANRVGHTGIKMDRQWPGPGLIKNVTVVGFDRGISLDKHGQFGMTFEKLTLQHQRAYGLYVSTNTAIIHGLTSANSVPALYLASNRVHAVLLDAVFTGGASGANAITSWGKLYARDVKSTGYGMVIQDNGANNRDVAGGSSTVEVAEYKSFGEYKEFPDAIPGAIQLTVMDTPEFNTTDFSQWVNVKAMPGYSSADALPAIQKAIDAGKPIVYLPQGSYSVSNTIVLKGPVRKFIGLGAYIGKTSTFPAGAPLIRFDGETVDFTILQNLRVAGDVQHNSDKTLVIAHSDIDGAYGNTSKGKGELFLEDVIGPTPLNINTAQKVWARQLNIEFHGDEVTHSITNNEGTLWILGYKTEGKNGSLLVNNGGWVELLGGFFYPNKGSVSVPMLINKDGALSATYKKDDLTGDNYAVHVRDIRGTQTLDFTPADVPYGNNCALYSGAKAKYSPEAALVPLSPGGPGAGWPR